MKTPRISVILPSYNAARFIGDALESLFAQTYTDYEVIVVNDGSPDTDELERVLAPYRSRITYIKQENRGVAAARNTAVAAAGGEWIAQLDPDDIWEPEYLEAQIRFIDDHPEADVVYANAVVFGDVPEAGRTLMDLAPSRGEVTLESLARLDCQVHNVAALTRREAILRAGMFDESLRTSEDFDLWLRIVAGGGRILYHTASLARYRRHPGSLTADAAWTESHVVRVLEKHRRTLALSPAQREVFDCQIELHRARMQVAEGKKALAARDWAAARRAFGESQRHRWSLKIALAVTGLRVAPWLLCLLAERRPETGSLTGRAFWLLFARTCSFAISIALPLLLVRRLDRLSFGLYKQVFLVVNTAINVLPLGFAMSAYYFLPREPGRRRETVLNIVLFLTLAGGLGCAVVTAFPGLLVFIARDPAIIPYAPRIGLVTWLWIVGAFVDVVFIAGQEMQLAAVAILASQISRTVFFLLAAIVFGTVESLLGAAIFHGVLQTLLVLGYLAIRYPRFWASFDARFLRTQLSYALPLGVAGLVYTFQTDLHNYFVSARFGSDVFALYAVGCFQLPLVQLLGEAAAGVLIPRIAELQQHNDTDGIISVSLRATRKLAAAVLPAYAFLLVTAREFISFLFTAQYAAAWPVFVVNLTMMPLSLILLDPLMRAYAEYRYRLVQFRAVLLVLLSAGLWWATGRFGMIGAISVVVALAALERVVMTLVAVRVLHFGRRHVGLLGDTGKLALSACLAAIAAVVVRLLLSSSAPVVILLACGLAFGTAYVALVFLLGIPTHEEVAQARRLLAGLLYKRRRAGVAPSPGP